MMQQYLDIRSQYEGYIMMYRLGDFYECFFEDAIVASRELELTLTGRDCGEGRRAAMCGVPFHKSDVYIGRLVEKGYRVAICEQVEDPKAAQGLVRRDVVRVVTPGTVTDASLLNETKNNYLASLCYGKFGIGLAFLDISTGEISATYISTEQESVRLENELSAASPSECIINVPESDCSRASRFLRERCGTVVSAGQSRYFAYENARNRTRQVFSLDAERLSEVETTMAVGALLQYVTETQKTDVTFIRELNVYSEGQYLELDLNTRRNLELVESMRTKEKKGSLLWVLDKTKTAMGARLLRTWLLKPLLSPVLIEKRQSATEELYNNAILREELTEALANISDIERLCAKAVYGTANAKDLYAIGKSLLQIPIIKDLISTGKTVAMRDLYQRLDTLDDVAELLMRAIVENPPFTIREGGMIRDGFNEDLDYYRGIQANARSIMHSIEERERENTGIRTLKVDYNKVFGYYIEVSKSFIPDVPDRYIRKQTLTNAERYITQELKEMESTILGADEKIVSLEFEIFNQLRLYVAENSDRIRRSASLLAELDVYRSFAEVASKNAYCRPEVDMTTDLIIQDGRHPVVEKFVDNSYFVPNDTTLDTSKNRMMLITGPNMAGKSTYMRQVALIVIMAQIGSFVPARSARIGIVDKVFTRVGASDDLASGQSTFMLEMNEVASILKNATKKSLIVYDEVGRGTSTFDGMAIARAVVEYTHSSKLGAKTLFATHYHELVEMEEQFEGIVNYNIAAKKRNDTITFLRKIVRGGTDDSYGIEVAKLAGVPNEVVKRAREILADIEHKEAIRPARGQKAKTEDAPDLFTSLISARESEVCAALRAIDLNTTTPIEAIGVLYSLKKQLEE
ncbi:MAG: DNA mismatch repair protein MutS [Clostridia bacterium]|nr:DNA mismatch repair protein MutS [Clostridia bacterium]